MFFFLFSFTKSGSTSSNIVYMKVLAVPQLSHLPPKSAAGCYPESRRRAISSDRPQSSFLSFRAPIARNSSSSFFKGSLVCPSSPHHQMATKTYTSSSPNMIKLKPIEATPRSFQEFGQVIEPTQDGDDFGPHDAQLDLSHGIPRFYIMRIEDKPLVFSTITHHASVTQCFGSVGAHVWYLGVAKPSIVDPTQMKDTMAANLVQSQSGHFYTPPAVDDVRVFRISGPKFLKLNRGTWHAGPLFPQEKMDFYNLELNNTNVVDHTTHDFGTKNIVFSFDE